ncbi:hypothetical protein [Variovorax terrae]|uniref:SPOR domain-containing protein n=1 Tax=Variovorax terrae TaxID=2923278 RepID=A0A9X2AP50_9BURK|nr:hypothetical protein [Variovorax terrae]MCJ0763102.1 hypothetical protein [Variovorax terrae]
MTVSIAATPLRRAAIVLAVASSSYVLAADADDRAALREAATGSRFTAGTASYRLVPRAAAQPQAQADASAAPASGMLAPAGAAARSGGRVVGRLGGYAIVLDGGPAAGPDSAARAASGGTPGYLVAVNQRSGAPALVAPRLKVFCAEAGRAEALAQASGGRVLLASQPPALVILGFDTPQRALAAADGLRRQSCVQEVQPEVLESFAKPH